MAESNAPVQNESDDIRPVIATGASGNLGLWAFLSILLLGGAWLFSLMSAAREQQTAPRTIVPQDPGGSRLAARAPPQLPRRFTDPGLEADRRGAETASAAPPRARVEPAPPATSGPQFAEPATLRTVPPAPSYRPPPRREVLFEARAPAAFAQQQTGEDGAAAARVRARRLANPSFTVPLGTVIPAVLETALDSTQPGSVRALVQRDIYSFDGSRVLIPRGSRLYGAYKGELKQGQNRAFITWTRLLRPDGVTIALASPASDPLGRAGVKGDVDGKFWQRFGGAILQSVLDIGVGVATREVSDGVVVALPGSTQNMTRIAPSQITPTLRVEHGTSVSVYVARDLDFSTVER